jgi:hypothetical protein
MLAEELHAEIASHQELQDREIRPREKEPT